MATVTANLTGYTLTSEIVSWNDNVSLGTTFGLDGNERTLDYFRLFYAGLFAGLVQIEIVGFNARLTPEFEASGRFIIEASDGETVEITLGGVDMTEAYALTPTNSAEVIAFANHVRGLTDQNATLTLTDDPVVLTGAVSLGDLTLVGVSIGDVAVDVLLGDILLLSSGVVVPSGPTPPWDFATSFSDGYAVDFIGASPLSDNRLFEVVPPSGTLNRGHPAGMFVDNSIYAIERVHRFTDVMILLHNGGQSFPLSQSDFIPALSDDWTWYIIQLNTAGDALADSGLLEGVEGQQRVSRHWRRIRSL